MANDEWPVTSGWWLEAPRDCGTRHSVLCLRTIRDRELGSFAGGLEVGFGGAHGRRGHAPEDIGIAGVTHLPGMRAAK